MEDPEISAMVQVASALSALSEDEVGRVLRWALDRHGVSFQSTGDGHAGSTDHGPEAAHAGNSKNFEYFAELFSVAAPKTDVDKALVAAYWVQVQQGTNSWQSRALNAELKNLGHSISNVTTSLSASINRKPQLIIQLKKSGTSQQSNKTYKLTTEGVASVEKMLNGGPS